MCTFSDHNFTWVIRIRFHGVEHYFKPLQPYRGYGRVLLLRNNAELKFLNNILNTSTEYKLN